MDYNIELTLDNVTIFEPVIFIWKQQNEVKNLSLFSEYQRKTGLNLSFIKLMVWSRWKVKDLAKYSMKGVKVNTHNHRKN
jgi:hypothetical protein